MCYRTPTSTEIRYDCKRMNINGARVLRRINVEKIRDNKAAGADELVPRFLN